MCYLGSPKDCVSLLMAWNLAHPAGYDERGRFHDHIAVPKLVSEESSFGGQKQQGKPQPWRPPGAPHFLEQLERHRNQPWGGFRQPMAGGQVAEDEGSEAPLSEKHHGGNVQERRGHFGKGGEGTEGRTVGLSGVVDFDEEISRFEAKQRLIQSLQKRKKQPGAGSGAMVKEARESRGGGSGEIDEGRLAGLERDFADLEARIDSHAAATLGDGKALRDTVSLGKNGDAVSGGSVREAEKAHAEEIVSGGRAERRGIERQRDFGRGFGKGLEAGGSDRPSTSRVSEARNEKVDLRMTEEGGGHELGKEEERGLVGEDAAPPVQGCMLGESLETRLPEQSTRGKAPGNEGDENAPESLHPPLVEGRAAVRNRPNVDGESEGSAPASQPPQSDSVGPSASGAPTKPPQNTGEEGSREDSSALPHQPRNIVSNQVETVSNGQAGPVAEGSGKGALGVDPASREARKEPNQSGRTPVGGASSGAGPSVPGRRPAVVESTIAGGGRQTERRPVSAVETMAHLERLSRVRSRCLFEGRSAR
jgi:hypothetical protein